MAILRVACVGDNQVDSNSRLEEHNRVMAAQVERAAELGVTLTLHAGDVFERQSNSVERQAVRRWLRKSALLGDVVVVAGNHEAPGEVNELAQYELTHDAKGKVWTSEVPSFFDTSAGVRVACLPWPRKANLLRWLGRTSMEDASQTAGEMLQQIITGMLRPKLLEHAGPRVLLLHGMVRGSVAGPDQPPFVGCDMELGLHDLAASGADVVIMGHIHLPQEWEVAVGGSGEIGDLFGEQGEARKVPLIFTGSPRRTAYAKGELVSKGFVVVEFDTDKLTPHGRPSFKWHREELPATPMVLVEGYWGSEKRSDVGADEWQLCVAVRPETLPEGAEVRLRYDVAADRQDAARAGAQAWVTEALKRVAEVKLEPVVVAVSVARAPEIVEAKSLPDKLGALWRLRDPDMDDERRDRLLGLADELTNSGVAG